jgi:glycosyltransferase involved in cell wall biosynthesis
MQKKILYIWKSDYPWDVRVDKICTTLYEAGYDVTILCRNTQNKPIEETINNIKIFRVGGNKPNVYTTPLFYNPYWSKCIEDYIKLNTPDLVIVREMLIAELSAKICNKYNIPIIMDMAENYPACIREWKNYNNSLAKRFIVHKLHFPDIVEKRSVPLMDGIITVCKEQNERLQKQFTYNLNDIEVVHNTPIGIEYSSAEYKPQSTILLGHHGYMTAEKSLKNLVEAFAIAKPQNIKLLLAGNGDCKFDYENIIKFHNAEDYFELTGKYNYNQLQTIMQRIDIGIIPYQISDFNNTTIHNKIFDFWTAGKPVIVSEAKPLKRLVSETNAGISIDCESVDSIIDFLDKLNNYDWNTMTKNTEQAFQKYNWNNDKTNLLNFVKRFL